MNSGFLLIIVVIVLSLTFVTAFEFVSISYGVESDNLSRHESTCKNQISNNKPPEIYNVTPTSDGAVVRWYQSPQSINGMSCGFPDNYQIFVSVNSPAVSPFVFSDNVFSSGFRGTYTITGLEPTTTYHIFVRADWEDDTVSISSGDISFTTLSYGEKHVANNPFEQIKDEIGYKTKNEFRTFGEFSTYENQNLGFKIKYPKEFDVKETLNDTSFKIGDPETKEIIVGISDKISFSSDVTEFFKSPDVPFSVSVRIYEIEGTMEETKKAFSDEKGNLFFGEITDLGGQEALGGTITDQSDFHDGYNIGTIYEGKQYSVFFMYPREQAELYIPTIQYIIDSFEFTNEDELVCGPNTKLEGGICVVIDGGCEPDINGNTFWCDPKENTLMDNGLGVVLVVLGIGILFIIIIIARILVWKKENEN